ncbi:MAG: hypothetical protein ABJD73_00945, partial [Lentilitoribacter sp.]
TIFFCGVSENGFFNVSLMRNADLRSAAGFRKKCSKQKKHAAFFFNISMIGFYFFFFFCQHFRLSG